MTKIHGFFYMGMSNFHGNYIWGERGDGGEYNFSQNICQPISPHLAYAYESYRQFWEKL